MNNTNTTNNINIMTEDAIKEKYLKLNNIKLQAAKAATIIMIIAALFFTWSGSGTGILKKDLSKTVYDNDKILSLDDTINVIESRNAALSELTGNKDAQIIVVVEKGRSSYKDLEKKADKLFKSYKISESGMLFVVAVPNSKSSNWGESIGNFFADLFGGGIQPYAYHPGSNLGDFAEVRIDGIFDKNFDKNYDEGKYNAAILDTFNALADYFDEYYKIDSKNYKPAVIESSHVSQSRTYSIIIALFIIVGVLLIVFGVFTKKNPKASRVYKRPFWFGLI